VVGKGSEDRARTRIDAHITSLCQNTSLLDESVGRGDRRADRSRPPFALGAADGTDVLRALLALRVVVLPIVKSPAIDLTLAHGPRGPDEQGWLLCGAPLELREGRLKE